MLPLGGTVYEKNPASHYKSGLYVIKTNKVQLVYCDMSLECAEFLE